MAIFSVFMAIAAVVIVFLEILLGGGFMALLGTVFVSLALWMAFSSSLLLGSIMTGAIVIAIWMVLRFGLRTLSKSTLTLTTDQAGYKGSSYDESAIGKMGIVEKDLRPCGVIEIDDRSFQALSEIGYVKKGSRVRVIGGRGGYLIVR